MRVVFHNPAIFNVHLTSNVKSPTEKEKITEIYQQYSREK